MNDISVCCTVKKPSIDCIAVTHELTQREAAPNTVSSQQRMEVRERKKAFLEEGKQERGFRFVDSLSVTQDVHTAHY